MLDAAVSLADPAPAYRRIETLETERNQIAKQYEEVSKAQAMANAVNNIDAKDVLNMLKRLSKQMKKLNKEVLKDMLGQICEKILLDPNTLECVIHYRIPQSSRVLLASPRGRVLNPRESSNNNKGS